MLEWLEREFNLEPPWRCDLCNSESPAAAATCFVCESPKGHQTIKGRAAKYFEFRLLQEFLFEREEEAPKANQLIAAKNAIGFRGEGFINEEELKALEDHLVDLASNNPTNQVLQSDAGYALFTTAHEPTREKGRGILVEMGRHGGAVRGLCARKRTERVAKMYRAYKETQMRQSRVGRTRTDDLVVAEGDLGRRLKEMLDRTRGLREEVLPDEHDPPKVGADR
jgi:hypothetical protein